MQRLRAWGKHPPPRGMVLRWLIGLGILLALVAVFTELAEDVWFREGFAWDAPLILALHQFSRPWLDTVMRVVTQAGQAGAIGLALVLAGWFLWRRRALDAATCLLYTSDAADERSSVDLGGRRIIKKKNKEEHRGGLSSRIEDTDSLKGRSQQNRKLTDKIP